MALRRLTPAVIALLLLVISACSRNDAPNGWYDGRLEADLFHVSTPVTGRLLKLQVDEGDSVTAGQIIGLVDSARVALEKERLQIQIEEVNSSRELIRAQQQQAEAKRTNLADLLQRTRELVATNAASAQKVRELETELEVVEAQQSQLRVQLRLLDPKVQQLKTGIEQADLQLAEATLKAGRTGVVIRRYLQEGEWVAPGRPVLTIADKYQLIATLYLEGEFLSRVQTGQSVSVRVDGLTETLTGTVTRISDQAEFTPKFIQTHESRTALVYGVEVSVRDDRGRLKIGMPVDVQLFQADAE